jgi:hypothetical protein
VVVFHANDHQDSVCSSPSSLLTQAKVLTLSQFKIDAGSLADIKFFSCEERKVTEALPPEDHPDYLYTPKPIACIPPVCHNLLLTIYHAPRNGTGLKTCQNRMPTYLHDKVPLRVDDGLGSAWGLELVEGRRWEIFWYVGTVVLACSTVVGLVYGVVQHDVSAGFTVAGFLQTCFGVGVALATLSATVDYLS